MTDRATPDVLADEPQDQLTLADKTDSVAENGRSSERRHPRAFARRLAIAFASVAALTMVIAAVVVSVIWNYQFERWVRDNLQSQANDIAQTAGVYYPAYEFGYGTIFRLPVVRQSCGVNWQLLDGNNQVVWDAAAMQRQVMEYMQTHTTGAVAPEIKKPTIFLQPSGQVVTAPIMVSGKRVGTIRMWAPGTQALLSPQDIQFRQGSLAGLALAGFVAMVFSGIAGFGYSRRLVRPIERITATAQALQEGDHDARTELRSDDEIGFLGRTFDAMADSIEADREMERRLTADVAHELRTPLQAIQATVEAMQDGVLPADGERLGIVRDETRRLARLADGILELTRLERGSLAFDMRRIDASAPVHAAVDSLEALIETCELTLSSNIAEGIRVCGDRDRLQQAVGNLLSNAARYTPAGGHVDVSLRRDGDSALFEVADTGVGIAEEDLHRVFARFWRADGARAAATGGLGIGLAVTKEIVERHGGTITVGKRRDGASGAVFAIRLPLA